MFAKAIVLANEEFYIEALNLFNKLGVEYFQDELADDALFNAGMCYFHLNLFEQAIKTFKQVIDTYPEAEIYQYEGCTSFGKTAAKCHYANLNCYLGLKQVDEALKELDKLKSYTESSYELTPLGEKISYTSLGQKALISYKQFQV